jgi:hypothetical protein
MTGNWGPSGTRRMIPRWNNGQGIEKRRMQQEAFARGRMIRPLTGLGASGSARGSVRREILRNKKSSVKTNMLLAAGKVRLGAVSRGWWSRSAVAGQMDAKARISANGLRAPASRAL